MSHLPDFAQAIAEQRQAEFIVAAQDRQARLARLLARGRSTAPLQSRARRAAQELVRRFPRRYATT